MTPTSMTPPSARRPLLALLFAAAIAPAQQGPPDPGPAGPGAFGGPGGPGPSRDIAVKERFDADRSGQLDAGERALARAWLKGNRPQRGPGRGGPGGPPFGGPPPGADRGDEPRDAAPKLEARHVAPDTVARHPDRPLYDPTVVRTFFLEFDDDGWFEECADFYRTDVTVPATLTVDGRAYRDVGVAFRGNSSYFGVRGKKRSLALTLDDLHQDQRLRGCRTLNLLNAHDDPSFLREVVHALVAGRFTPVARANVVHVVVNGESFGPYASVEQINADFLGRELGTRDGVRWKVPANPRGGGGLADLGEDRAAYERGYQLKSKVLDPDAAWARLIRLCRVLAQTPDDRLEAELPRVLDIDATLWFLAVDCALLDGDGYYSRASDFVLWEGPDHRFRPLPYDSNEILRSGRGGPPGPRPGRDPATEPRPDATRPAEPGPPGAGEPPQGRRRGGFGPGGMMGAASPTSSPLVLLESKDRPLARLLRVPAWRAAFLAHVRALALEGMDWSVLGPVLEGLHTRLDPLVQVDDKALYGYAAFRRALDDLRGAIETRRKALLDHPALCGPWPSVEVEHEVVGSTLRVRARASAETPLAAVLLWVAAARHAAPEPIAMHDDGQHDDGAAGDGVYGAASPRGEVQRARYWVEVRSAAGTTAFAPSAAGGRPVAVRL